MSTTLTPTPFRVEIPRITLSVPNAVGLWKPGGGGAVRPDGLGGFVVESTSPPFYLTCNFHPLKAGVRIDSAKIVRELTTKIVPEMEKMFRQTAPKYELYPDVAVLRVNNVPTGAVLVKVTVAAIGGVSDSPLGLNLVASTPEGPYESDQVTRQGPTKGQSAIYSRIGYLLFLLPDKRVMILGVQSPFYSVPNYEATSRSLLTIPEEYELDEASRGFTSSMFAMLDGVEVVMQLKK